MIHSHRNDQTLERGDARRPMTAFFVAILAVLTTMAALAAPANAEVAKVGPVNPDNGNPYWYEDANGLQLDQCLDNSADSKCLRPFEMPNPDGEISFPDNYPGEAFWWTGEASTTLNNGSDALLVTALEGTFANEEVKDGDQMSFGRIRIRVDGLEAGEQYRISHPFGTKTFTATPVVDGSTVGEINVTEDIGCFPTPRTPCDFGQALSGKVGPFLTWDTFGDPDPALAPPAGYVGDPDVLHKVEGSVVTDDAGNAQNYFKVEKANEDGTFEQLGSTDEFAVSGKLAKLQVGAAPARDTVSNDPSQEIKFVASDPDAQVYYTTDGSDPAPETGTLYNGPFAPPSEDGAATSTTYRFVAVKDGQSSGIREKTYTVDRAAPNVTAESVDSDAAADAVPSQGGGSFDKPQKITLKASEAADIHYTTDGSDPADENNAARKTIAYDPDSPDAPETILVERSQEIRAIAVDEAGNKGQPKTFGYTIAALAKTGPMNPQGGFPFWYQDAAGTKLDQCLDNSANSKCLVPFEMPNPDQTMTFPENYPGEAFYWTGEASTTLNNGSDALLVMAMEAAFASDVVQGDQMSFGRIRIRIDGLQIGREYRVTHPYGVDTFTAEDDGKGAGEINSTVDIGCVPGPNVTCDFDEARFGRVGPFLSWDTFGQGTDPALADAAGNPDRYVGDPNIEHAVKGSPYNTNLFKIERLGANGPVQLGSTDQFAVSGKLAEFQASVNRKGGSFNKAQAIELGASEANSEIYYTLDGSEPTPDNGTLYTNSFVLDGDTTLKFRAYGPVPADGSQRAETPVYTEDYVIDAKAPVVKADPAGFRFTEGNPQVALSADEPADIYYTTNGINPTVGGRSTTLYNGPININKTTTLKFMAIDKAGNNSGVATETYTDGLAPQAPTMTLAAASDSGVSDTDNLTRNTNVTINGTAEAGATVRILVGGTQKASVTAAADGSFSADISGLQPGANNITATATDAAGNQSTSSGTLNVQVDTTAPAAPTADPASGNYDATQQVKLNSAEAGVRIFYTTDGSAPLTVSRLYTVGSPISVARTTTVRAISIDAAGNVSDGASFNYVINATAPTITNFSPTGNTRDRTPTIRATVRDSDRTLALSDITLRVDGAVINSNQITYNANTGALSYTPRRNLALGNIAVRITVTDAPRPAVLRNWSFTINR
ncbi:MAG TPA: chitobiase/beta-hexosaminidase C-terminal domain-containing protein [Rubrobacter sp.]|nr:chitobiase/beta-hexosaminidase C-terminal domain-containing protein [Rubrobacter sp.]